MSYEQKAILFCEKYGIIKYRVNKNMLVFYKNHPVDCMYTKYYTVRHVVNLDTMNESTTILKKLNKEGFQNV